MAKVQSSCIKSRHTSHRNCNVGDDKEEESKCKDKETGNPMRILSPSKMISVWLIPPEPLRSKLLLVQDEINSCHLPSRRLPSFIPHITLIGGAPISNCVAINEVNCRDVADDDLENWAARIVLQRLRSAFRGYGAITCNFVQDRGVITARLPNKDGDVKGPIPWNQSCVSIVENTKDYIEAMRLAAQILFAPGESLSDSIERHFQPPLMEPHYSFAYGSDPSLVPKTLTCPPAFESTEMIMMWTDSAGLEGVEQWSEIGRIDVS